MAAKYPDIHKSFPDWYRVAGVDPANQPLEARWRAVCDVAASATSADVCDYVRLAHSKPALHDASIPALGDTVRKHDPAAPLDGNDFELSVISSAVLMHLLGSSSTRADLAALALSSAAFMGWPPVLDALQPAAEAYIESEAEHVRAADEPDVQAFKVSVAKSYEGVAGAVRTLTASYKDAEASALTFEQLKPVLIAIVAALDVVRGSVSTLEAVDAGVSMAREETELLWWFETLAASAAPEQDVVGVAQGLAERTRHLPSLPGPHRLLTEALTRASVGIADVGIVDHLSGVNRARLGALAEIVSVERDLTPLAFAASRACEVTEGVAWVEAASAVAGMDFSRSVTTATACLQIYRELMFVRAFQAV